MQPLRQYLVIVPAAVIIGTSCVSTGKFKAMQQQASQYDSLYTQSMRTLQACQDDNKKLTKQKSELQEKTNDIKEQLTVTQESNSTLRKQLQSISAISTAQAESLRKSMDNMGAKDSYIMALHSAVASRDSANMALILELKAAIGGYSDQGLTIKLENGAVHLDIKDSLLFGGDTTSFTIADPAKQVLSRMARVLNDHPSVEFMIEAHTDTLSDAQDSVMDSWDLSAKRATSIARLMQKQYHVAPSRITAAGRGEYAAMATTDSAEALLANHRTRITFLPQQEQLMRLIDHKDDQPAQTPPPAPTPQPPTPNAQTLPS